MKLRDYQEQINEKVLRHLKEKKRCCVSLATGAGKTFTFISLCTQLLGNTLILVNRIELVNQTSDTCKELNIEHTTATAKKRTLPYSKICIGMVQTIQSRFKKNKFDFSYYDNIIVDECHRLDYAITLDNFNGNIIGFTATPMILKKITYETETGQKISKKIPLSNYYYTLIEGVDIAYLINNNYLVPEQVYELKTFSKSGLLIDEKTGEYTTESLNNKFDRPKAYNDLYEIFNKQCSGKKNNNFQSKYEGK